MSSRTRTDVKVYGCNHVAIEVDDIEKAVEFYQDVFNLEKLDSGEGDAFFKLGEHQFLAIFEVKKLSPGGMRHFGIMVRDEQQLAEVREKLTKKYQIKLIPPFRCDFRDPFGNRVQVVDLHDESLVWLLPYQEVQKAGIKFGDPPAHKATASREVKKSPSELKHWSDGVVVKKHSNRRSRS
jgi:catechol 2,3-dioxygenase-like lactoylglutathione lyase family enzyme